MDLFRVQFHYQRATRKTVLGQRPKKEERPKSGFWPGKNLGEWPEKEKIGPKRVFATFSGHSSYFGDLFHCFLFAGEANIHSFAICSFFGAVIAESLARVIAAIRITSVCWWSYLSPKTQIDPQRPCVCCVAAQISRDWRSFVKH